MSARVSGWVSNVFARLVASSKAEWVSFAIWPTVFGFVDWYVVVARAMIIEGVWKPWAMSIRRLEEVMWNTRSISLVSMLARLRRELDILLGPKTSSSSFRFLRSSSIELLISNRPSPVGGVKRWNGLQYVVNSLSSPAILHSSLSRTPLFSIAILISLIRASTAVSAPTPPAISCA